LVGQLVFTIPILAFTFRRSGCSRCSDPRVHDGPKSATTGVCATGVAFFPTSAPTRINAPHGVGQLVKSKSSMVRAMIWHSV
jgi:hypothetical protein